MQYYIKKKKTRTVNFNFTVTLMVILCGCGVQNECELFVIVCVIDCVSHVQCESSSEKDETSAHCVLGYFLITNTMKC